MLWYYQAILAILVITVIVMVPGNTVITELTPLGVAHQGCPPGLRCFLLPVPGPGSL